MKLLFALGLSLLVSFLPSTKAVEHTLGELTWLSWEAGIEQVHSQQKMALILIANDDCSLTQHYLSSSFQSVAVHNIIVERYVPIIIKPTQRAMETKSPLLGFLKNSTPYPAQLQQLLENKALHSPTLVILDQKLNVMQSFGGYIANTKLGNILTYYGDGHYKNTPWERFLKAH